MSHVFDPQPRTPLMQRLRSSAVVTSLVAVLAACSSDDAPKVVPQERESTPSPSPSPERTIIPEREPSDLGFTSGPSVAPRPTDIALPSMVAAEFPNVVVSNPGLDVTAQYFVGTRGAVASSQGQSIPQSPQDREYNTCATTQRVTITTAPDVLISVVSFDQAGKSGPAIPGTSRPDLPPPARGSVTVNSAISDVVPARAGVIDGGQIELKLTSPQGEVIEETVQFGGGAITRNMTQNSLGIDATGCKPATLGF